MDDPSPIDPDSNGPDNNPGGVSFLSSIDAVTDGNGKATVEFTVSMYPGDNYRIAASGIISNLTHMTQTMADNENPPVGVALSEMLTVWRKLHVEADSMEAVATTGSQANQVAGTAASPYSYNSGTNKTTVDLQQNLDPPWEESKSLHFENGSYKPGATTPHTPLETISHTGDDEIVVQGDCSGDPFGYILRDDDDFGILPRYPDTSLLNSVLDDCYIECVIDAPGSTNNVPFIRNIGGSTTSGSELLAASDIGSDTYEAADYWVVYLLSGFQAGYSYDRDPDTEGGGAAFTEVGGFQAAVILLEHIRDAAAYVGINATTLERQAVVHEIGHQILEEGDSAHTVNTIMDQYLPVATMYEKFSDAQIAAIRSEASSPGE